MISTFDNTLTEVLETLVDAVFVIDDRGIILWSNATSARMFGWSREEFVGRNISCIVPSPHKEHHDAYITGFIEHNAPVTHVLGVNQRLEAVRRDGSLFPVEVGISAFSHGNRPCCVGFVRDITDRLAAESRMYYLANYDQSTGLANRVRLMEEADRMLAEGRPCTMAAIGVVGLRRIAERHGHNAVEYVLHTIAERLRNGLKGDGFFARAAGELFAGLFGAALPGGFAESLVAAVDRPISWGSIDLHLGATVGLARSADAGASGEEMLRAARAAAGDAQVRQGLGGVETYTEALGERLTREAVMESNLRDAVAMGRLFVAMQPKVRADDGRIVGAEALARWQDAQLGLVPPSEFVPLAERTGIIGDLGDLMMRLAMAEAAAWHRGGLDLTVAVNLSAVDLRQAGLPDRVKRHLQEIGCPPERIVIELTESALVDDPDQAQRQLRALKALGVALSLDDFGTGYSSLSYLRRFPFDTLKIDQSFVRDIPHDADATTLVRSIIALARSFGMGTIAEGVETAVQADMLRDAGVDVFQGYFYGRPMAPDALRGLAAAGLRLPAVRS